MADKRHIPFVPPDTDMKEFTVRALVIGLVMCVVLGAANAYLGLKAGMTIAATYPAAVIGMALLRIWKGSILEENFARTVGSIGESVAAGAIFTLPAFLIAGVWTEFWSPRHYLEASAIMLVGGVIGILFVTMLRRVMVEDPDLPFPESRRGRRDPQGRQDAGPAGPSSSSAPWGSGQSSRPSRNSGSSRRTGSSTCRSSERRSASPTARRFRRAAAFSSAPRA